MTHPTNDRSLARGFALALLLTPLALAEEAPEIIRRAERAILQEADATQEEAAEALPLESETPLLKGWKGSIEFGLSGSTGNTEKFDGRGSAAATRETDKYLSVAEAGFQYGTSDGNQTKNEYHAHLRNDWKLKNPRWRYYAEGRYEYDDFQEWQHRITLGTGFAYQAVKNEKTELILRAGVQVIKEISGSENAWVPEGVLGFALTHQLTQRQQLGWTFDFFPQLDRVGPYRFVTDAYWKIDVDPENNLFLRVGVHDEYDSTPGAGFKRNDLDYYATLGWSF